MRNARTRACSSWNSVFLPRKGAHHSRPDAKEIAAEPPVIVDFGTALDVNVLSQYRSVKIRVALNRSTGCRCIDNGDGNGIAGEVQLIGAGVQNPEVRRIK